MNLSPSGIRIGNHRNMASARHFKGECKMDMLGGVKIERNQSPRASPQNIAFQKVMVFRLIRSIMIGKMKFRCMLEIEGGE